MRYLGQKQEKTDREVVSEGLSVKLQENIDQIQVLLQGCSDAVVREFTFGRQQEIKCVLLYFDGLINRVEIEENLLKALQLQLNMISEEDGLLKQGEIFQQVKDRIISMAELKTLMTMEEVCHHISSGDTVLLIDGYDMGLVAGTRSWQTRSIQSPENEAAIQGPKEGFNETLRFNTALLRRRLKSTQFKIESTVIGRISKTDVIVCYIKDIASESLINDVKTRLQVIDIDGILDTGYLEEYLADIKYTIFSQVEYTEKPDRVCGHLLEGRICIMVDGSPMAMIVPTTFPRFLVSGEDYYQPFIPGSLYRILRFFAFWIALLLPSFYVALISFHQEMIPVSLYLTIAASREGIPFPGFIEALLMELTFELLREAGLRLPRMVGPAVSIVGALIIGDAAVQAGLVSTPMVVVVAFTGIASFVTPAYNASVILRIARFGVLFAAGILGFMGIIIALLFILIRMASIESLGQPYLAPITPLIKSQISDILVRRPWTMNKLRPTTDGMKNQVRQGK